MSKTYIPYFGIEESVKVRGGYIALEFTGASLEMYGTFDTTHGIAEIKIDGKFIEKLDTYGDQKGIIQKIFSIEGLENKAHTFIITVLDEKNPASSDYFQDCCYFIVNRGDSCKEERIHVSDARVTHSGFNYTDNTLWGNSTGREPACSHTLKICYVKNGQGMWNIEGTEYPMEAGDIFILSNNEKRKIVQKRHPENINILTLEFEPSFIWSNEDKLLNLEYLSIFFNRKPGSSNRIPGTSAVALEVGVLIAKIDFELANKVPEYELMVKAITQTILVLLKRHFAIRGHYTISTEKTYYLRRALDHINENYKEDIFLNDLASMSFMSCSKFSRLFKQLNGIHFHDYLARLRINKVIDALNKKDDNIIDIAFDCGFNNSANFYKTFKRITGKTPKEYKNT